MLGSRRVGQALHMLIMAYLAAALWTVLFLDFSSSLAVCAANSHSFSNLLLWTFRSLNPAYKADPTSFTVTTLKIYESEGLQKAK
jgi:hypothetical protein